MKNKIGITSFIPPKYRPLAGLFTFFGITFVVLLITASVSAETGVSVADVFGKYFLALAAIIIFFILSVYSIISGFADEARGIKFSNMIGEQTTIDDMSAKYKKPREQTLQKAAYLIAVGKLQAVLDTRENTVTACGGDTPVEQMLPAEEYEIQRKKRAKFNMAGIIILIVATLINAYYVIDALFISGDDIFDLLKGFGAIFLAVVLVIQITVTAYYYPAKCFERSKKIQAKGRRAGVALSIFNFAAILLWVILIFVALNSGIKTQ